MRAAALAALALLACSSSAPPRAAEPRGDARATDAAAPDATETTMNKTAQPDPAFERAQPTSPRDPLAAWLERVGDRLLRVPVELDVDVMGITGGSIGFGADRLAVKTNDSALGVSLADRAAELCGDDATTCAMWVHAHWKAGTLQIVKVEGAIEDRAAATHVFVAK